MSRIFKGILYKEPVIFEKSEFGHEGFSLPPSEELNTDNLSSELLRNVEPTLPELSEVEVVRHYTRLSDWNHSVEKGMYPLGSCTMKYNPKVNDEMASLSDFQVHPLQKAEEMQGSLELMYELEQMLKELSGFSAVTLQPSAGANGEFTGIAVIKKAIVAKGEQDKRKKIIIPDTAHGTNPASIVLNEFEPVSVKTGKEGYLLPEVIKPYLNDELAGIMVTNPNTLGIYETHFKEIADLVHKAGGYVYMDGANFNAIMGKVKPAEIGVDAMHFNLHKTFSTPHGGGGPGAGPVGVTEELSKYLPVPRVEKTENGYTLNWDKKDSIGKVHSFFGNFDILIRAYVYILENGTEGLAKVTERAVLNARYMRALLEKFMEIPYETPTLHEAVFSDKKLKKETGITTMDIAKNLLDYGYHPPTVYFPLIVSGAFMVEPTETENRHNIEAFAKAVEEILNKAETNPDEVHSAPHKTALGRLNETFAARKKILRWNKNLDK